MLLMRARYRDCRLILCTVSSKLRVSWPLSMSIEKERSVGGVVSGTKFPTGYTGEEETILLFMSRMVSGVTERNVLELLTASI